MMVIYPDTDKTCCCNGRGKTQTRTATLKFLRPELVYDAENYAYVEGDIMGDENKHQKHQVMDIAQDGNVDRVTRVLNLAHAECVEMLYPYTKEEIEDGSTPELNDVLAVQEEYTIELTLPSTFSKTTVNLLANLIHEYLVCRVLQDWFSITYPDASAAWAEKLMAVKEKISTAIMSRTKSLRRRMSPF